MVWKRRRSASRDVITSVQSSNGTREPRVKGILKKDLEGGSQKTAGSFGSIRKGSDHRDSSNKSNLSSHSRSNGSRSGHSQSSSSSSSIGKDIASVNSFTSKSSDGSSPRPEDSDVSNRSESPIDHRTSRINVTDKDNSANNNRPKGVRFSEVHIRDYERIVGDNPSCSAGPPIAIGWAHGNTRTVEVGLYEESRPYRKRHLDLVLTRDERESMLLNWGISFDDIVGAIRTNIRVKNQRRTTVNNLGRIERLEEAFESVARKLKRTLLLRRRTGDKVKEMREQANVAAGALAHLKIAEERVLHDIASERAMRAQQGTLRVHHEIDGDELEDLHVNVQVSNFCRSSPAESHVMLSRNEDDDDAKSLGASTSTSVLEMEAFYLELEREMFGDFDLPVDQEQELHFQEPIAVDEMSVRSNLVGRTLVVPDTHRSLRSSFRSTTSDLSITASLAAAERNPIPAPSEESQYPSNPDILPVSRPPVSNLPVESKHHKFLPIESPQQRSIPIEPSQTGLVFSHEMATVNPPAQYPVTNAHHHPRQRHIPHHHSHFTHDAERQMHPHLSQFNHPPSQPVSVVLPQHYQASHDTRYSAHLDGFGSHEHYTNFHSDVDDALTSRLQNAKLSSSLDDLDDGPAIRHMPQMSHVHGPPMLSNSCPVNMMPVAMVSGGSYNSNKNTVCNQHMCRPERRIQSPNDGPVVRHMHPPSYFTPTHWMENRDCSAVSRSFEPVTIIEDGYDYQHGHYGYPREHINNYHYGFESQPAYQEPVPRYPTSSYY